MSLLAVRLHDEVLHLFHGLLYRDNARDAEEGTLEDGVGAVAEPDFLSNLGGVDGVELDVLLRQDALDLVGHVAHEIVALPDGVEQERTVLLNAAQHVVHAHVALHVARHKVGRGHQVGGADGVIAEAEVRAGETARLLRVVREVSLAILVGCFTDDFDRVLVGTHRTIGTETVELGLEHTVAAEGHFFLLRQRSEGHVVDDTHGEVVLRFGELEVFVNRHHLCRGGVV